MVKGQTSTHYMKVKVQISLGLQYVLSGDKNLYLIFDRSTFYLSLDTLKSHHHKPDVHFRFVFKQTESFLHVLQFPYTFHWLWLLGMDKPYTHVEKGTNTKCYIHLVTN